MSDIASYQEMIKFSGINNVDDPTRLAYALVNYEKIFPLSQALNVDIDNSNMLKSRPGRVKLASGSDVHSYWSDAGKAFWVDGDSLYQMLNDFTGRLIRTGLSLKARMSYANFNDKTYYCNGIQGGYVQNYENYSYMNPSIEFKEPLPVGKFIDVFMGCVYTSVEDTLYIGDPLCDYYDTRYGYRRFANPIKMIRAIDDGVFIGENKVWFLKGMANEDFDRLDAYPEAPIPYTDLRKPADWFGYNVKGDIAIWTGDDGICVGDNSGNVRNETRERYVFTHRNNGAAFVRDIDQVKHYVNSLF